MSDVIGHGLGSQVLKRLEDAGLTPESAQQIVESRGNKIAKAMVAAFNGKHEAPQSAAEPVPYEPFRFMGMIGIVTVPQDWDQGICLTKFMGEYGPDPQGKYKDKDLSYVESGYTDTNFGDVTDKLVPGEMLQVDAYQVMPRASSQECVDSIHRKEGLYVGAQGLTLVYRQLRQKLPRGKWYFSFDKQEKLPRSCYGEHMIPNLLCSGNGDFRLYLIHWDGDWDDRYVVLIPRRLRK